jgi:hypothetical protein
VSPKKNGSRNRPTSAPRKSAGSRPRQAGGAPRNAGQGRVPSGHGGSAPVTPSIYTPGGSSFRHWLEGKSAPALLILTKGMPDGSRRPRPVIMFAPLALLLLGFFLPLALGIVALAVFLLFTAWLAYLSWPRTDARARLIRAVMFLLVVGLIVLRVSRN